MKLPLLIAALIAAAPTGRIADSPVADAAMRRDSVAVRRLIAQRANVNAPQGDGMTALHWAAANGDFGTVRLLVGAGAKVEAKTRNGSYTPLHMAARNGRATAVKALIRAGANVNAPTSSGGAMPIHFAAGIGDPESITALLDAKANVNAIDSALRQTPVMWAAAANRVGAIKLLVARGADLRLTSRVDSVAVKEAADRAATQAKRRVLYPNLVAQGGRGAAGGGRGAGAPATPGTPARRADSTSRDSTAKPDSALAAAIAASAAAGRSGSGAISGSGGNDPTAQNAAGGRGAGRGGRGGGANDLYGNKGGLTALLFAAREGHTESVMALLDAGADINQVSAGDHSSPLLLASINGHFDLAMQLLARGADPKLASDAGATPLYATINVQWAAKSLYPQPTAQLQQRTTHLELMEALLKAGADPNVRLTKHLWYMSYNFDLLGVNTTGATPFWRAAYGTDVPAMRLLKKYGADPLLAYTTKTAGRLAGADAPVESDTSAADPSGIPPVPNGGPGVLAVHAASGVGYGEGYAANSHMHAPDGWIPSMKYLIEELGFNVNARDQNGYTPLHHAAARGDNDLIRYLVSQGADVKVISRRGQTVVDMANGPTQRISPFPETIKLLESLGAKNSNKCRSC
ncbi:MAG TPA: ankyrin repeat domain-containing protein [Gemmatimonadaceae bacterium]|nr:ankyrin repeat domain-containing protein [Gemmatimonadaceae bacterium]